ncbi:DUF4136 domain-containing protein [Pseudomonas sp. nanlin1]|uniref:DUF4136 domain-containing protein n=1 Tax=Pseudomonas sp. nanlin1 TaxID=3040605 RepID=UPI003890152C
MLRHLTVIALTLLIAACQARQASLDFDNSRDFAAYRNWAWAEPALQYQPDDLRLRSDLTEQRVRQAISEQLDQRGLRPAAPGARADLQVRAYLIVETRQQQVTTQYSPGFGNYWGGYWGSPIVNESRNVDYRVATLQVDLLDGKDGKLVWRSSVERIVDDNPGSPGERNAQIQGSVARIMANYPPR